MLETMYRFLPGGIAGGKFRHRVQTWNGCLQKEYITHRLVLLPRATCVIQHSWFPHPHFWHYLQHHLAPVVRTPYGVRRRVILLLDTRLARHVPVSERRVRLAHHWPIRRAGRRRFGPVARKRFDAGGQPCGPRTRPGSGDGCAGHCDVRGTTGA